jgi:alcohol dehydrogenase (cytochrome c)
MNMFNSCSICIAALIITSQFCTGCSTQPKESKKNIISDWPSYNLNTRSDRFVTLTEINSSNVSQLRTICEYDTKEQMSFQTGLIQVDGALIGTTEHDIFSIDPNTCKENWRTSEDFPGAMLKVNRGAAYLEGRLFRGTSDGRVLGYDAKSGKRLWDVSIADGKKGEAINAAPIAWNGMVFIGNAGGDNKGVKGRMYGLEAATGKIMWEFYLVPKEVGDVTRGPEAESPSSIRGTWKNKKGYPITGGGTWTSFTLDPKTGILYIPGGNPAPDFVKDVRDGGSLFAGSVIALDAMTGSYKKHYPLVLDDFHDWDVSSAPAIINTKANNEVMAVTPKDGYMYLIDLKSSNQIARLPMTTINNEKAPIKKTGTRFCPGTQGGSEWNGPAYNPNTGYIFSGQVDWCSIVKLDKGNDKELRSVASGQPWTGSSEGFGKFDDPSKWNGWVSAVDTSTNQKVWTHKTVAPVLGGITSTASNIIFGGDMSGYFFALDANTGDEVWKTKLEGAIGGGVISYDTGSGQRIAVAYGMTSPIWPTNKITGRVVIMGL